MGLTIMGKVAVSTVLQFCFVVIFSSLVCFIFHQIVGSALDKLDLLLSGKTQAAADKKIVFHIFSTSQPFYYRNLFL